MTRALRLAGLALLLACGYARTAAAQDIHLIIVTGVSGDDEHKTAFSKMAARVVDEAKKAGLPAANITYLSEQPDQDPTRSRERSTRDNVTKALTDVAARAKAGDDVFVLLIGHGSFDGKDAAFNLPGPDLTVADWGMLLDKLNNQRVIFINTASSSGAFLEPLKKSGRTILTATKTGGERNEPRFAEYFVEGLVGDAADRDRDGRVSILEAFDYAQAKVKEVYEQGGHILTEHAMLEDGAQGKVASAEFIMPDKARAAIAQVSDPALRTLLEQQNDLQRQVAALRVKKDSMEAAEYDRQLEKLLTDLALKTKEVRDREAAAKK